MIHALASLLFGALFTIASAWAFGAILLRRMAIELDVWEQRLFAFLTGSACLSAFVFLLCSLKVARRGEFIAIGVAAIGDAVRRRLYRGQSTLAPLPRPWRGVFGAIFLAFGLFYLMNAMAPEMSPDGTAYHLAVVAKYARAHGFTTITTNMHDSFSQGIEMLFLFAFVFGRHSAAALVHFVFWIALAFLILNYGRRIGRPTAGVVGALFTALAPVLALDGSVAYVDVAQAAVLFALFYLLQVWDESRSSALLVPIGILAGFSYAVKYTGGLAIPYALIFLGWKLWKARRPVLGPLAMVMLLAAVSVGPWMAKNWIEVANPISPFANRLFPNPYVHVSQEENWRHYLAKYELTSYAELPMQLTVKGNHVSGFFGPLFLLAPLALLALRIPQGRRLLLAIAIFGAPYFGNVGARFLIPAIPFLATALALALADLPWLLMILTAAHAIASAPPVYKWYTISDGNWMLAKVSPKAAFRLIPEETYLSKESGEYNVDRMIERLVPANERVFSFYSPAESYTSRDILVSYLAADNELMADTLWTPLFADFAPTRRLSFHFAARPLQRIRVIETETIPGQQWSVSELRVLQGTGELLRERGWKLTASPNPWDVQLAFDNSPATRWRSWQDAEPGMHLDVDFGRLETADAVVVESSDDCAKTKIRLEGMAADGQWIRLADKPEESPQRIRVSLRQAATYELKARGVRYLLVDDRDIRADDFRAYANLWGLTRVGQSGSRRLYLIQ